MEPAVSSANPLDLAVQERNSYPLGAVEETALRVETVARGVAELGEFQLVFSSRMRCRK